MENKITFFTSLPIRSLITLKHNPYMVNNAPANIGYRSVLSYNVVDNLQTILHPELLDVIKYDNLNPRHNPL